MFSEDISQKISQKIEEISLFLDFRVCLDSFEIFVEDLFLLRSSRKFLPSASVSRKLGRLGACLQDLQRTSKHQDPDSTPTPNEERFRWWVWFPGFYRVFCIHHWPGKFFFAARKVPQKIFFRWWSCTFFSSLPVPLYFERGQTVKN